MAAVTGNIQKALLIIHNKDIEAVNSQKISKLAQYALEAASVADGHEDYSDTLAAAGMNAHVMQVQYNPSSLSIQANAEPIPFTALQQHVDAGVPNQSLRPPMVALRVELIFDAMNPQDAFMMDKIRISAGKIASDIAGGIKNAKGGYSVEPQTAGLVAALLKPSTRAVTFRWADMAFTGQLFEVQAEYTMFSVSGKPIRSKVKMNKAQQVESDADFQYWDKALNKVFGDSSDVSLKNYSQEYGNILNLDAFGSFM